MIDLKEAAELSFFDNKGLFGSRSDYNLVRALVGCADLLRSRRCMPAIDTIAASRCSQEASIAGAIFPHFIKA